MEHIGEQASWSGLHMLGSGVQAVNVAPAHGGQLGGTSGGFLVGGGAAAPLALYQEDKS